MGAVFTRRGILPESGGTWMLPRLLGWAKAAELVFRGRILDAQEALALGLVNVVVPHERLAEETRAWAEEIAGNAPLAVQAAKRLMRLAMEESYEASVHHAYLQLLPLFGTEDFKEGASESARFKLARSARADGSRRDAKASRATGRIVALARADADGTALTTATVRAYQLALRQYVVLHRLKELVLRPAGSRVERRCRGRRA